MVGVSIANDRLTAVIADEIFNPALEVFGHSIEVDDKNVNGLP